MRFCVLRVSLPEDDMSCPLEGTGGRASSIPVLAQFVGADPNQITLTAPKLLQLPPNQTAPSFNASCGSLTQRDSIYLRSFARYWEVAANYADCANVGVKAV